MEGESYLVINPDTLSDRSQWSYRDIQLLCMRLGTYVLPTYYLPQVLVCNDLETLHLQMNLYRSGRKVRLKL
jgi:hypothetical protein